MKQVAMLLAATAAICLLVNVIVAEDEAKPTTLKGVVVKVDGAKVTVKTGKGDEAKDVVVTTDDDTKVTIDKKEAKVADLKEGMRVIVTPAEGTAKKIVAYTPKPKKQPE